jgi:exonuclease VII small subunit
MTIEDKLLRLQEIYQMVVQKKVTLTDTVPLVEEAYKLMKEIEKELNQIENKLVDLSKEESEPSQS